MIADTNIIIRILQGDTRAIEHVATVEEEYGELHLSTVTEFELYHSIERVNNSEERLSRIKAVLETKQTYSANSAVMRKAGRIDGRLTADGNTISVNDTIIAATALVHEEAVLTENTDHFERVDGLTIKSYI